MEKRSPRVLRDKVLNLVYFIDGSPTKHKKIPLKFVVVASTLFASLLVWSFVSIVFLAYYSRKNHELREDYRKSLAKILEFQTSTGQVYERAYPQKETAQGVVKVIPTQKTQPTPETAQQTVQSASTTQKSTPSESTTTFQVSANNPRYKRDSGVITFSFDLRNLDSKGQSEGYLWVVMEFLNSQKETIRLTAPQSLQINEQNAAINFKQASRFNIRRFRERSIKFQEPKNAIELVKATVFVTDLRNSRIDKFEFITNLKLAKSQRHTGKWETADKARLQQYR